MCDTYLKTKIMYLLESLLLLVNSVIQIVFFQDPKMLGHCQLLVCPGKEKKKFYFKA